MESQRYELSIKRSASSTRSKPQPIHTSSRRNVTSQNVEAISHTSQKPLFFTDLIASAIKTSQRNLLNKNASISKKIHLTAPRHLCRTDDVEKHCRESVTENPLTQDISSSVIQPTSINDSNIIRNHVSSNVCQICKQGEELESLIFSSCNCKNFNKLVHRSCLSIWGINQKCNFCPAKFIKGKASISTFKEKEISGRPTPRTASDPNISRNRTNIWPSHTFQQRRFISLGQVNAFEKLSEIINTNKEEPTIITSAKDNIQFYINLYIIIIISVLMGYIAIVTLIVYQKF